MPRSKVCILNFKRNRKPLEVSEQENDMDGDLLRVNAVKQNV